MIEGSWKGMKKYLEQDMLCAALRGRLTYHLTRYRPGSDYVYTVCLDGRPLKQFSFYRAVKAMKGRERGASGPDEYTDAAFSQALRAYRNQPVAESLASDDPIVRMFAFADRRAGVRTLRKLAGTAADQPDWLRDLLKARLRTEEIPVSTQEQRDGENTSGRIT